MVNTGGNGAIHPVPAKIDGTSLGPSLQRYEMAHSHTAGASASRTIAWLLFGLEVQRAFDALEGPGSVCWIRRLIVPDRCPFMIRSACLGWIGTCPSWATK